LFLGGCSVGGEVTQPTPIPPTATMTASPSQTLTSTVMPTNTPTLTPLPTLSQEEAIQEITELMQTNAGCTTPCVWGISPFLNSFSEAQNFFSKFGGDWGSMKSGLLNCHTPDLRFYKLDVGVSLCEKNGEFRQIVVDLYGLNEPDITNQDWLAYRPDSILRTYGLPTYIRIFLGMGPTPPGQKIKVGYTMIFIYEPQHFVLYYFSNLSDQISVINSRVHICPLGENKLSQFRLWIGKDSPDLEEGGPELIEGISMTKSELYELLLGDPVKACFDANFDAYFK
jgi:hypothetical protein